MMYMTGLEMSDEWEEDNSAPTGKTFSRGLPDTSNSGGYGSGGGAREPRAGDWPCPSCSANNFSNKTQCFKCSEPRPEGLGGSSFGAREPRAGDWPCPSCSANNFSNKTQCFKCSEPRPEGLGGSSSGAREARPGDWPCPSCSANNFSNKTACFKCSEPRPEGLGNSSGGGAREARPGDWICTGCQQSNFASRNECFKCQETKSADAVQAGGDKVQGEKPRELYIPPEPSNDENEIFGTGITSGINFDNFDKIKVKVAGDNPCPPLKTFEESKLREFLLGNVTRSGYTKPTPIQRYAIPNILAKRDLMACAQTGSGKTAAFLLPMLHTMLEEGKDVSVGKPQAVILSPTRELAIQIFNEARKFAMSSYLKICIAYGGTASRHQGEKINQGCHVLVCTPGRLFDFVDKGQIQFDDIRFVVLDEADRMLDMGFKSSIDKLMGHQTMSDRKSRQTLMFSATFPEDIQTMAMEFLNDYVFLAVGIVGGASADVEQNFVEVTKFKKRNKLNDIIDSYPSGTANGILIFVETKRNADFLASFMSETKIPTTSIHGDRLQREREEAINDFKSGRMKILIATSVAARGLDIKNVTHVINYDLPKSVDDYVHRIGRTGRVGNRGKATSFYDPEEDSSLAPHLCRILQQAEQAVPDFLGSASGSFGASDDFGAKDIRAQGGGRVQETEEEW